MLSSLIYNGKGKKNFPGFITGSDVINANVKIEKIFPLIGLSNSKQSVDVQIDTSDIKIDKLIHLSIKKYLDQWKAIHKNIGALNGIKQFKMSNVLYLLNELDSRFNNQRGLIILKDRVLLSEKIPSYDNKTLVKKGTNVYALTQRLLHLGSEFAQSDLISGTDINKECKNLQLVFSSNNWDGAWDIATMSMRGIKSCMRWENEQSASLVGSIVDPGCGIIYLTNMQNTNYGSKMLFRALVRLLIDRDEGKPLLGVDRLYSTFYKNKPGEYSKLDQQVKSIFINWLKTKVKCRVEDLQDKSQTWLLQHVLPTASIFRFLKSNEKSYMDFPIEYSYQTIDMYYNRILESCKIGKKVSKSKNKLICELL